MAAMNDLRLSQAQMDSLTDLVNGDGALVERLESGLLKVLWNNNTESLLEWAGSGWNFVRAV
jgi:hypothetical protein